MGLAASIGAGLNMGLAEALSDDGKVTGRGNSISRGFITGIATTIGGMLHTLPFLMQNLQKALRAVYVVVAIVLVVIAMIRYKFMKSPLLSTVFQIIIGGRIVFLLGIWLGKLGVDE